MKLVTKDYVPDYILNRLESIKPKAIDYCGDKIIRRS